MRLITYFSLVNKESTRLIRQLRADFPEAALEICGTLKLFLYAIRQQPLSECIAILYIQDEADISTILGSQYEPIHTPSVLILGEDSEKTVSMGWKLKPRYVSINTSHFDDVIAVLKHQLSKMQNANQNWEDK